MIWRGRAPAKINLTLHITGQRADGYHLLDSLVVFADVADEITLTEAAQMSLSVSGPFAPGVPADASNLMWKAASLSATPLAMTLEKHLPHPAGIGGGSADAACVLRGIQALNGQDLADKAAQIGADVPVCLHHRPQIMQGIGEILRPAPPLPPMAMVLINPKVDMPTAAVFGAMTHKTNPPMGPVPKTDFAGFCRWLGAQRNDMEPVAKALEPAIGSCLAALGAAPLARMSGSGATCFGLYPDLRAAEEAAKRLMRPGWWVKAAQVLS